VIGLDRRPASRRQAHLTRADIGDPRLHRIGPVSQQLPPRRSQLGSTLVAKEQLHSQVVLNRANLTRQHGLGGVQTPARPNEVQMPRNSHEVTDLAKIKITHQASPSPLTALSGDDTGQMRVARPTRPGTRTMSGCWGKVARPDTSWVSQATTGYQTCCRE
jgi:hypothetical protein